MTLTISILSILLFTSIGLAFYFGFKLYKAINEIERAYNIINENENFIGQIRTKITDTYTQLKDVDERNLFDKDDDVGFVFTNIVQLIEQLTKTL